MSTPRRAHFTLLAASLITTLACDSSASRERSSAADVARAEEQLRSAENSRKASVLTALDGPCEGNAPCEVQRLCRPVYRLHVEAVSLTEAAKQQLADGHAERAAKLLGSAEEKLKQAQGEVASCTLRAGALPRQYKL